MRWYGASRLLKVCDVLCQDERVMQLFGLVNTMLANDHVTAERDLSIARYASSDSSPRMIKTDDLRYTLLKCLSMLGPLSRHVAVILHVVSSRLSPHVNLISVVSQVCGNTAVTKQRAHWVGAKHGHAARADPGVPRRAQDPAQRGAPPYDGHGAGPRPSNRHPEGGGL